MRYRIYIAEGNADSAFPRLSFSGGIMIKNQKIWVARDMDSGEDICLIPGMANRHGLIAGATGTGKTVTLKVLAESFSKLGVPVFLSDVKGDLSGMIEPGADSEDMQKRMESFGLSENGFQYQSFPSEFFSVNEGRGFPLRTTVSEMGPTLLARLMDLSDLQSDLLSIIFRIADEENLLLIDTKDLKAMIRHVTESTGAYSMSYGNLAPQSLNAILRNVVSLETSGGDRFFGEPAIDIFDFFKTDLSGKGMITILDARQTIQQPRVYGAFMLYLLSELFEKLPEVGDTEKPKMVFFFDEAHVLFDGASKALLEKITQVVKLIRSRGVSIFFATQNPADIPEEVLSQISNKIQHGLRAYTPKEQKSLKSIAESYRVNPAFNTEEELMNLGTGEAIISLLEADGKPAVVSRCRILPPESRMGGASEENIRRVQSTSLLSGKYDTAVDRDSAYEFLLRQTAAGAADAPATDGAGSPAAASAMMSMQRYGNEAGTGRHAAPVGSAVQQISLSKEELRLEKERQKLLEMQRKEAEKKNKAMHKEFLKVGSSAAGTVGREIGKGIGTAVFGKRFGKTLGGNVGAQLGRGLLNTLFRK